MEHNDMRSSFNFYPPLISQWFMHGPYTSLTNATHAYQPVASDFQFIQNQAGRMFSNIHCTGTQYIISVITSFMTTTVHRSATAAPAAATATITITITTTTTTTTTTATITTTRDFRMILSKPILQVLYLFWHIRKMAKSDCWKKMTVSFVKSVCLSVCLSVCPSVPPSTWNNLAPLDRFS